MSVLALSDSLSCLACDGVWTRLHGDCCDTAIVACPNPGFIPLDGNSNVTDKSELTKTWRKQRTSALVMLPVGK